MSLLAPWGLAVAALAAVPLLLHLLRRDVVQRIAFPALRYLRNAERRTARSMRFRDLLLLAARVSLVVLLAVAAARPLAGRGGASDHAPTDVVLLVDNSASMSRVRDGRTLLDRQLDVIRATLEHATPADRFWLVPTSGPPLAAGVDAATTGRALDSLAVTDASADIAQSVERAVSAVPVREGRFREVQLYTDAQATGFAGGPVHLSAWGRVVVSVAADASGPNAFVADLRLEPDGTVVPGDPPSVAVAVAMEGGRAGTDADTLEVRLLVDGATVAMARAAPGSEALIALPDLAPGPHSVRAELAASGLRADDVRRLGIAAAEPPVVRSAGPGGGFLATALATLEADGRIRTEGDEAIHVIEGAEAAPPAAGRALVLVPPEELTRVPAFQQRLDALGVPWRVEGRASAGELELRADPALPGLEGIRLRTIHGLERLAAPATADDSVLLRAADGAPWLVRGRVGDRVYLLLASPLVPEATTLPVSAVMVPFVERLVLHWSRPSSAPVRAADAGSTVVLPSRIDGILAPDGTRVPAEGGAPWTPTKAGTWTFLVPDEDGPREWLVGVNVPARESALEAASEATIRSAFAGTDVELAATTEAWTDVIYGSRRGGEATPWVVGLIVLLGLFELFLAAPGRRPAAADAA